MYSCSMVQHRLCHSDPPFTKGSKFTPAGATIVRRQAAQNGTRLSRSRVRNPHYRCMTSQPKAAGALWGPWPWFGLGTPPSAQSHPSHAALDRAKAIGTASAAPNRSDEHPTNSFKTSPNIRNLRPARDSSRQRPPPSSSICRPRCTANMTHRPGQS